jgi:hypothetical protein
MARICGEDLVIKIHKIMLEAMSFERSATNAENRLLPNFLEDAGFQSEVLCDGMNGGSTSFLMFTRIPVRLARSR